MGTNLLTCEDDFVSYGILQDTKLFLENIKLVIIEKIQTLRQKVKETA